ncbi:hypothetical protein HPP92_009001 [Vanilla planifolia]|uniref:Uncharacterized protein n=1 Tax=Vanilla planifolia TaxID=51239 RepID=A0A835R700_VANPL|nr:hypothetical protein HPP92_009001 [Vanilla planifolia]
MKGQPEEAVFPFSKLNSRLHPPFWLPKLTSETAERSSYSSHGSDTPSFLVRVRDQRESAPQPSRKTNAKENPMKKFPLGMVLNDKEEEALTPLSHVPTRENKKTRP